MPTEERYTLRIEEFINQEHDIIEAFSEDWVKRNAEDEETWPMEMTPDEWDEQLRLFHDECNPMDAGIVEIKP